MMYKLRQMLTARARDERGFTLVELMMVMVIIGTLAGLGFTGFNALQKRTARTRADVAWRDLSTAVQMFRIEEQQIPATLADLYEDDKYLDQSAWGSDHVQDLTDSTNREFDPNSAETLVLLAGGDVCVWVLSGNDPVGATQNKDKGGEPCNARPTAKSDSR